MDVQLYQQCRVTIVTAVADTDNHTHPTEAAGMAK
jgi:hypothetical protein